MFHSLRLKIVPKSTPYAWRAHVLSGHRSRNGGGGREDGDLEQRVSSRIQQQQRKNEASKSGEWRTYRSMSHVEPCNDQFAALAVDRRGGRRGSEVSGARGTQLEASIGPDDGRASCGFAARGGGAGG